MIASAADLWVRSPQETWSAHHHPDRPSGPAELRIGETAIVRDVRCQIGKFCDELAVLSGHRQFRKSNAQVVLAEGYLPFGAEVRIRHTHRYFDGILRVTSDIHFPRDAHANPGFEVGSMTLPGTWTHWREPGGNWQTLSAYSWSPIPPCLLLRRADGPILEIGLGNDIWRWHAGLLGANNRSQLAISATDDGLQLRRIVSESADLPMPAQPRTFRYSWYLAWLPAPAPVAEFADAHRIDLAALGFADSLCRSDGLPCLAAGPVTTALKRQLRKTHDESPIVFANLGPGLCECARHVKRKGRSLHSDSSALIEFAAWTRKLVGPNRPILLDCPEARERPLLAKLFRLLPSAEDYLMADTADYQ
jgi:hypothetical protein